MADVTGVRELPNQRVVLAHDPGRAGLDAVRAIDVVGALHAAVGALPRGREAVTGGMRALPVAKWKQPFT